MLQAKVVEEITNFLCLIMLFFFFRKYCRSWGNVGKCCRVGQATWRILIACWISKATNTPTEYETLIVFPP